MEPSPEPLLGLTPLRLGSLSARMWTIASLSVLTSTGVVVMSSFSLITHFSMHPVMSSESSSPAAKRKDIIRGVNVGGWLVLEPWITPSLFFPYLCPGGCPNNTPPVIDERSLCERLGPDAARGVLDSFRSQWVTEATFSRIADAGLNTVRIPYGYWIYGDAKDFCPNISSISFLDSAIEWATKHSLQVVLDLHGVPYSQNGQDNSGTSLREPYALQEPKWDRPPFNGTGWLAPEHLAVTRSVLRRIATRYAGNPAVTHLGLVNEWLGMEQPWCAADCPMGVGRALNYFEQTWESLSSPAIAPVLDMGEGTSAKLWEIARIPSSLGNGTLDLHEYQAWYGDGIESCPQAHHLNDAACKAAKKISRVSDATRLRVMVGEWSTAMTNCHMWLNGVGAPPKSLSECSLVPCPQRFGTLPPNASDAAGYPTPVGGLCPVGRLNPRGEPAAPVWGSLSDDEFFKTFTRLAMHGYEASAGWTFWNFDNEMGDPRWSFFEAHARGWFPANLSTEAYTPPVACCDSSCVPVKWFGTVHVASLFLAAAMLSGALAARLLAALWCGAKSSPHEMT
jgi:glucan 1,3-beta-glucosidase